MACNRITKVQILCYGSVALFWHNAESATEELSSKIITKMKKDLNSI